MARDSHLRGLGLSGERNGHQQKVHRAAMGVALFGVVASYWTRSSSSAKHRGHDNKTVLA